MVFRHWRGILRYLELPTPKSPNCPTIPKEVPEVPCANVVLSEQFKVLGISTPMIQHSMSESFWRTCGCLALPFTQSCHGLVAERISLKPVAPPQQTTPSKFSSPTLPPAFPPVAIHRITLVHNLTMTHLSFWREPTQPSR